MTPNRTAPPVARRLVERPAAPPVVPVLVGDALTEERLLLREDTRLLAEDTREERLLPTLEMTEEILEGNALIEEAERAKSTSGKFKKGGT
jgi:hypothetical protein